MKFYFQGDGVYCQGEVTLLPVCRLSMALPGSSALSMKSQAGLPLLCPLPGIQHLWMA